MVLFLSFAASVPPEELIPRIEATERIVHIPWTNEAIAFHSYECIEGWYGSDWLYHVIDAFTSLGYPLINTEVPCRFAFTQYPDLGIYSVLEEKGIGWLSFVNENLIGNPTHWRGQFEAVGLAWKPDYGNWPVPDAIFPFGLTDAAKNVAQMSAKYVVDEGRTVLSMNGNDYVSYSRLNFGTREPMSFRVRVKSTKGGVITVREGGPNGKTLGSCVIPAGVGYTELVGDIYTAVRGIADATFVFTGQGTAFLSDWQYVLPKQVSYTDPLRIIHAADYPFRSGDIVRRASTDKESEARLQVEGITNGSSLLFDFVRFRDSRDIRFNIRAMPIAGGSVEIQAGDFCTVVYKLGVCKIGGSAGVWTDFSCGLDLSPMELWSGDEDQNTRWDLKLVFIGESGRELFAVSEFWFGNTRPDPADRFEPKVKTGFARSLTDTSAVISENRFWDFEEHKILEAGIEYSDYPQKAEFFNESREIKAANPVTPFSITLTGLLKPDDQDFTCYYRAYVKSASGILKGGVKRFDKRSVNVTQTLPAITTPHLPDGKVGTAYNQTLTATGGMPITWTLERGTLPVGLNFSNEGVILGTPGAEGGFGFTVKAENQAGSVEKTFSITVGTVVVSKKDSGGGCGIGVGTVALALLPALWITERIKKRRK